MSEKVAYKPGLDYLLGCFVPGTFVRIISVLPASADCAPYACMGKVLLQFLIVVAASFTSATYTTATLSQSTRPHLSSNKRMSKKNACPMSPE